MYVSHLMIRPERARAVCLWMNGSSPDHVCISWSIESKPHAPGQTSPLCSRLYSSISSVYTCSGRAVCSGLTADRFLRARPAWPRSAGRSNTLAFGHYKLRGLKSWCKQSRQRDGFFSCYRRPWSTQRVRFFNTEPDFWSKSRFPVQQSLFDFFPLFPLQSFKPEFAQNHWEVTKERVLLFAFRQLPYPLNQIIRWATQLIHHFLYLVNTHVLNVWKSLVDNLNWLRGNRFQTLSQESKFSSHTKPPYTEWNIFSNGCRRGKCTLLNIRAHSAYSDGNPVVHISTKTNGRRWNPKRTAPASGARTGTWLSRRVRERILREFDPVSEHYREEAPPTKLNVPAWFKSNKTLSGSRATKHYYQQEGKRLWNGIFCQA